MFDSLSSLVQFRYHCSHTEYETYGGTKSRPELEGQPKDEHVAEKGKDYSNLHDQGDIRAISLLRSDCEDDHTTRVEKAYESHHSVLVGWVA